ncbi:MAG: ABC transporter permease [Planctomycetes bacterium]|nr:ABC transporter permease [Planctomycetota bacterium]
MNSITTPIALFVRREIPSKQMVILTLACLLPSVIFVILRMFGAGSTFFEKEGAALFFEAAIPLVPIFYSVAAFHEEFEQRTIVYLLTRPPSRTAYVVAKFLTAWFCSILSIGIGVTTLAVLSMWSRPDFLSHYIFVLGMMFVSITLSTAVYTGIFLIFGMVLKYPVVSGLIYTAGWEKLVALVPGKLQPWTISLYSKSIFIVATDAEPQDFFPEAFKIDSGAGKVAGMFLGGNTDMPIPGVARSAATLVILAGLLLVASIMLFREREDV